MHGQLVCQETKRAAGGLVASKYKDECLWQDLWVGQGCEERGRGEMSKTDADGLSKGEEATGGVADIFWSHI